MFQWSMLYIIHPLHSLINRDQHEKHLYNQSENTKDSLGKVHIMTTLYQSVRNGHVIMLCFQQFWTFCLAFQAKNSTSSPFATVLTMYPPSLILKPCCSYRKSSPSRKEWSTKENKNKHKHCSCCSWWKARHRTTSNCEEIKAGASIVFFFFFFQFWSNYTFGLVST